MNICYTYDAWAWRVEVSRRKWRNLAILLAIVLVSCLIKELI